MGSVAILAFPTQGQELSLRRHTAAEKQVPSLPASGGFACDAAPESTCGGRTTCAASARLRGTRTFSGQWRTISSSSTALFRRLGRPPNPPRPPLARSTPGPIPDPASPSRSPSRSPPPFPRPPRPTRPPSILSVPRPPTSCHAALIRRSKWRGAAHGSPRLKHRSKLLVFRCPPHALRGPHGRLQGLLALMFAAHLSKTAQRKRCVLASAAKARECRALNAQSRAGRPWRCHLHLSELMHSGRTASCESRGCDIDLYVVLRSRHTALPQLGAEGDYHTTPPAFR